MLNTAKKIIKPEKAGLFRTIFIYTGQGESTLMAISTGSNVDDYCYVLIDSDEDKEPQEVTLVKMLKDLFPDGEKLFAFINTHPHKDHLKGVKEIYNQIGISEVWHSNHKPSGQHDEVYQELKYVLDKVGKSNEYHLKGSNDLNKIRKYNEDEIIKKLGNIDYQVLSPAEYVCDNIDGEDEDARYQRIHEQCAVLRFSYKGKHILITGDSDRKAWEEHITDYHKDNLVAQVLSASHHGSRTFFKKDKDDKEPYEKHIQTINPTCLVISAPKQKESIHYEHPHDDALELYRKHVKEANIYHLGNEDGEPYCLIVDIDRDGKLSIRKDYELIKAYGKPDPEKEKKEKEEKEKQQAEIHRKNVLVTYAIHAKPYRY